MNISEIVMLSTIPEQIRAAKAAAGSTAVMAEVSSRIISKIAEKIDNPVHNKIDDFEKVDQAVCSYNSRHAAENGFKPLTHEQYLNLATGTPSKQSGTV